MKKTKKIIQKPNVFAEGGLTLEQGMGVASGVLDLTTSAIGNLKTDTYKPQVFNAGSTDSFMSQVAAYTPEKARTESVAGNALSGAVKGAQAGMAFGNPLIGAGIGLTSEVLTTLIGNNKEKEAAKKAEELSRGNMAANITNIQQSNMDNYLANYSAMGGQIATNGLMSNGITQFNNGGTHEENPNGGIPQGIGANGLPNLVEEGEVKYKDYIFSDRLKANKTTLDLVGLPNKFIGKSYGQIAKNLQKESAERPNDPISQRGLADMMQKLKDAQEFTKSKETPNEILPLQMALGGELNLPEVNAVAAMPTAKYDTIPNTITYIKDNKLMYDMESNIPNLFKEDYNKMSAGNVSPEVINTLLNQKYQIQRKGTTQQATPQTMNLFKNNLKNYGTINPKIKPNVFAKGDQMTKLSTPTDYSNTESTPTSFMQNIDGSVLRYAPVVASGLQTFSDQAGWTNKTDTTLADTISNQAPKATRLYDKMTYQPLDTRWLQTQANAQQAATRSAIIDQAGGNRGAAMAGLIGANYSGNLQAGQLARQEQEYNQAQKQRVFEFNRATNQYNADADKWEQSTRMNNIIQGAQAREQAIQQAAAVRNANMNNFLGNITGVGQEAMNRNMITSNPALYYNIDSTGKVQYKQNDVAKYAKENNMTLAQAEEVIKKHAAANSNHKQ